MCCLNIFFSPEGQHDLIVWDRFGLDLFWAYHYFSYCAFQNTTLILALAERTLGSAAHGRQPCPSPPFLIPDRTLILFRVAKCQAENSISQAPLERGSPLNQCFISRNLLGGTSGKTSIPGKEAIFLSTFAFPRLPVWSVDYSCHPGCHCPDATMALDCSLWACYMGTVSPFWVEPLWLGFCTMQPNMIISVSGALPSSHRHDTVNLNAFHVAFLKVLWAHPFLVPVFIQNDTLDRFTWASFIRHLGNTQETVFLQKFCL